MTKIRVPLPYVTIGGKKYLKSKIIDNISPLREIYGPLGCVMILNNEPYMLVGAPDEEHVMFVCLDDGQPWDHAVKTKVAEHHLGSNKKMNFDLYLVACGQLGDDSEIDEATSYKVYSSLAYYLEQKGK